MDWIDRGMAAVADWVKTVMAPGDLRDLITDGVIAGVAAVLVFLPQILVLFLFTGLLESTVQGLETWAKGVRRSIGRDE